MVLTFLSSLFAKKEQPKFDSFLKILWLSERCDWIGGLIAQLMEIDSNAAVTFLTSLREENVYPHTSNIIKNLLLKYHQPQYGVCLQVSKMMVENTRIGAACALAIGTEKASFNKEFYHKIRVLKQMEIGAYRKYLITCKSWLDSFVPVVKPKNKEYTLGLFNEPLASTVKNTSSVIDILSLYKGTMYKNKIMRAPIELPLDDPFTQKDFHNFVDYVGDEPIVIICKSIAENVVPPKNFYLVFISSTKSFSQGIYPYVENVSTYNLLDLI